LKEWGGAFVNVKNLKGEGVWKIPPDHEVSGKTFNRRSIKGMRDSLTLKEAEL